MEKVSLFRPRPATFNNEATREYERIKDLPKDQWAGEIERLPEIPVFRYREGFCSLREAVRKRLRIEWARRRNWDEAKKR